MRHQNDQEEGIPYCRAKKNNPLLPGIFKAAALLLCVSCFLLASSCSEPDPRWLRGNLHTHTFWSDGDEFPESVVKWYRDHGYDFLMMTDHNVILEGERWRSFPENHPALVKYIENFGPDWVETKTDTSKEGHVMVRLKTMDEFRSLYESPDEFLLIMGNEISNPHAVHVLSFHQDRVIPVVTGAVDERGAMIGTTVARVDEYRRQTGINTWPALAHPNFMWAITAEMMINTPALRFFEVYNGHPAVYNDGDEFRAGTERIWDIVLASRLADGGSLLYGLATDDAHNYHGGNVGPGKGWVMVKSHDLTADAILDALDRGDFYSTTGVVLRNISFDGKTIKVEAEPRTGAEYTVEYIGTMRGFDTSSQDATDETGNIIENTTKTYSSDIGRVLLTANSPVSSYTFAGNELYVRVRVTSSSDQLDPMTGEILGKQKAWIQPVVQVVR
jgi:hypothetical protein